MPSNYATGHNQLAILRLLADGKRRTARQIALTLGHPVTKTNERLRLMCDTHRPTLVTPSKPKPPVRGRRWTITHLGREHLDTLENRT